MDGIIELRISTYAGFGFDGDHYYGRLIHWDGNNHTYHQIEKRLSAADIKRFNFREPGAFIAYKEGDRTTRLRDADEVRQYATKLCKKLYPHFVLVEGNGYNPDPVLIAPEPYKSKMNELSKRANDLGWYDGENGKEVDKIANEWESLLELAIEAQKKG